MQIILILILIFNLLLKYACLFKKYLYICLNKKHKAMEETITIEYEFEELEVTYELVAGEEESDIPASSDQIRILDVVCHDIPDYYSNCSANDIDKIEDIIWSEI